MKNKPKTGDRSQKPVSLLRTIFGFVSLAVIITLLVTSALEIWVLYHRYANQFEDSLMSKAKLLRTYYERGGLEAIQKYRSDYRIVVVRPDGTVIYDNKHPADQVDNHADRKEIISAQETGYGESIRFSDTARERYVYEAVLLGDGNVLRVSSTQSSIYSSLAATAVPMIPFILGALLIAFLVTRRISRAVADPILKIDLEHPKDSRIYQELEPLTDRLEEQNKQIAQYISDMEVRHELQDKMRQEFTANVSHELKTPLTSISGYAELIEEGMVQEKELRRFAGIIHSESQRLITLVGDIIKLTQFDGDEVTYVKEDVDLYATVDSIIGHLEGVAGKNDVTLALEGDHAVVHEVSLLLEELLYNLCDNAVKYNRPGGTVAVTVQDLPTGPVVSVADTGIGIPQDELERIFDRFYRVDKSHSRAIGGTGLGLSIVKRAANVMGAEITVESEHGKGTIFRLLFQNGPES
ncbi:MAG: ATP-binding protein [Clostridia bacterium]|nr:ATP-binding protein [Clostridia bacterium]